MKYKLFTSVSHAVWSLWLSTPHRTWLPFENPTVKICHVRYVLNIQNASSNHAHMRDAKMLELGINCTQSVFCVIDSGSISNFAHFWNLIKYTILNTFYCSWIDGANLLFRLRLALASWKALVCMNRRLNLVLVPLKEARFHARCTPLPISFVDTVTLTEDPGIVSVNVMACVITVFSSNGNPLYLFFQPVSSFKRNLFKKLLFGLCYGTSVLCFSKDTQCNRLASSHSMIKWVDFFLWNYWKKLCTFHFCVSTHRRTHAPLHHCHRFNRFRWV